MIFKLVFELVILTAPSSRLLFFLCGVQRSTLEVDEVVFTRADVIDVVEDVVVDVVTGDVINVGAEAVVSFVNNIKK